jgi:hypothetical protein
MPPHTVARTRHGARPRPRPAPARPTARRVSGPLRPAPAGAGGDGFRRGTTGVFERIRALPETRLVDGLLRGRVWIWLIGVLLGGIVAMQVSLLKLNAGISRAVTTTATLERQNANLEAEITRLSSGDRVREAAIADGMITPLPGGVEYLRSRGERDATRAARLMQAPSEEAAAIMENGGREPGVLAVAPVDPAATVTEPTTDLAATATEPTTDSTTTTTAPPAETTTTPPPVDPATGAATAPGQG